jgi:hypothetical protein
MGTMKMIAALAALVCVSAIAASAGPILWIDDSDGNIGTVDVHSGAVKVVGNAGDERRYSLRSLSALEPRLRPLCLRAVHPYPSTFGQVRHAPMRTLACALKPNPLLL